MILTKDILPEVLETRIGGKTKTGDPEELLGDGHHTNSTNAIELGRDIWSEIHHETTTVSQPHFKHNDAHVKEALEAAKQSRSKETKSERGLPCTG